MDYEDVYSEPRKSMSPGRTSSVGRHSASFASALPFLMDDEVESEIVSEAGDIGDRALLRRRQSESDSICFSLDIENGTAFPVLEDFLWRSHGLGSHSPATPFTFGSPLSGKIITSPASNDTKDMKQDNPKLFSRILEYASCLVHLATFGILGVLTRYLLEKLFGPGGIGVTNNDTILYVDLPSNMVGSFFMGWWGVVFKGDISRVSDNLAIGLTTGYLGSLTTFSGWNQKMIDLSINGEWVFSVLGFLIGLFLAAYSIGFGVETAKGFAWLLKRLLTSPRTGISQRCSKWRTESSGCELMGTVLMLLLLGSLWALSGRFARKGLSRGSGEAELWLACVVAPLGVWLRWFLARLNGRGLGKARLLKWVPLGTFLANISAACVMAGLSTAKEEIKLKHSDTVITAAQFGFLGCLSTVSTFVAEFHAMRQSNYPWRAYAYAATTLGVSFSSGILIYKLPMWIKRCN